MREKRHYKIKLKKGASEKKFEEELLGEGIAFEKKEYFPGYHIYKVERKKDYLRFREHKDVKFVKSIHLYHLVFRSKILDQELPKLERVEEGRPILGILDNGVARIEELSPYLLEDGKSYCPEEIYPSHGTFVAGVMLYGDELGGKEWVGNGKFRLYDAALVPDFSLHLLEEDELFERIWKAVEEHPEIRLWNLALSIRYAVDLQHISDFGLFLDALQERFGILICKSLGNGSFQEAGAAIDPFLQGADTALGLVVASCNEKKEKSSFSLSGIGHRHLHKPDLAMFGGDLQKTEEGRWKVSGVKSLSPEGEVVSSFGTSFATARITALLGELLAWKPEASPLFLKALVTASSSGGDGEDLGYGCPMRASEVKKLYERSILKEGSLEAEESFVLEGVNAFCLSTEVDLDYEQEEGYMISDVELEVWQQGEKKKVKCFHDYNEKFHNLKKYFLENAREDLPVEIRLRRRKKSANNEEMRISLDYVLLAYVEEK